MGKSSLFYTLVIGILAFTSCQEKTSQSFSTVATSNYDTHKEVYLRSLELKDYQTAIIALNYMHAEDSSLNQYTDSLIRLYAKAGLFNSVIKLGNEYLELNTSQDTIRELVAVSNNNMGNYNDALKDFELLYKKHNDPTYLYNMAKVNFSLKKPDEAKRMFKEVIGDTASKNKFVEFPSQSGAFQSVPLAAGCYMQLANMDAEANKLQGALKNLKLALKIAPNFETANASLRQLQEYQQYQAQLEMQKKMQQSGAYPRGYR